MVRCHTNIVDTFWGAALPRLLELCADSAAAAGHQPSAQLQAFIADVEDRVEHMAREWADAVQQRREVDEINRILMALLAEAQAEVSGLKERLRKSMATSEALKWWVLVQSWTEYGA
jgi:DNA-binding transcriptional regulator YbjK